MNNTAPTPPSTPPGDAPIWPDFFSPVKEKLYTVVSGSLMPFADGIFKAVKCSNDIPQCLKEKAFEIASYTASSFIYNGSNFLITTSKDLALGLGGKVISLSEGIMNSLQIVGIHLPLDTVGTNAAEKAGEVLSILDKEFISAIAPKIDQPFSAINLVGSTLLMGFFSKKCADNTMSVLENLKMILTRQRNKKMNYESPLIHESANGAIVIGNVKVTNKKIYTFSRLAQTAAVEAVFATIWGGLAVLTRQGLINAIQEAGETEERAHTIVNALAILAAISPLFARPIYKFLFESSNESEGVKRIVNGNVMIDPGVNPMFDSNSQSNPFSDYSTNNSLTRSDSKELNRTDSKDLGRSESNHWRWDSKTKSFVPRGI